MEVEYKNIDPKLIVNEIRNGRSIEAVQKLFGLRFKSEVQDLYMRGLMELGEIPPLDFSKKKAEPSQKKVVETTRPSVGNVGGAQVAVKQAPSLEEEEEKEIVKPSVIIRRKEKKPSVVIKTESFRTIGQSGSITLNKALLIDQLGFSIGDSFEIYREDDKIILQKTDKLVT